MQFHQYENKSEKIIVILIERDDGFRPRMFNVVRKNDVSGSMASEAKSDRGVSDAQNDY